MSKQVYALHDSRNRAGARNRKTTMGGRVLRGKMMLGVALSLRNRFTRTIGSSSSGIFALADESARSVRLPQRQRLRQQRIEIVVGSDLQCRTRSHGRRLTLAG